MDHLGGAICLNASISLQFHLAPPWILVHSRAVNFRWLPLIVVIALWIVFRVVGSAFSDSLPNFQPLAALFFCSFLFARGWRAFAFPAGLYALTYPIPAMLQGRMDWLAPDVCLVALLAFAATHAMGVLMRPQRFGTLLGGAALAAVVFHLITNGAAWIGSPLYPKSGLGLWQSLWLGPPGSPIPSWVFLKNLLAANLAFTAMLWLSRIPRNAPAVATSHGLTPTH